MTLKRHKVSDFGFGENKKFIFHYISRLIIAKLESVYMVVGVSISLINRKYLLMWVRKESFISFAFTVPICVCSFHRVITSNYRTLVYPVSCVSNGYTISACKCVIKETPVNNTIAVQPEYRAIIH